jgi:spoIIIJ-associated protein
MSGKTEEDAVAQALKLMRAKRDEVTVTVKDKGSKGIFGIGKRPVKVEVVRKDDPAQAARKFLADVTLAMGLAIEIETDLTDRALRVDLKGKNIGVLIGKHGQTLDSLQYLTNLVVNKKKENYVSVVVDTERYREKRKETLESLARSMAKKVRQSKRAVRLEPMSPSERKTIHATLQSEKGINTFSEGVEPFRNVVIAYRRDGNSKDSGGEEGGTDGGRAHMKRNNKHNGNRPRNGSGGAKRRPTPVAQGQNSHAHTDNYNKFIDRDGSKDVAKGLNTDKDRDGE